MSRASHLFIWLLPVVILFNIIASSNAGADRINLQGEFTYTNSDSETTNKTTGLTAASTFSVFNQRYNLDFSKTIYPYLALGGGTRYELNNSTSTFQVGETETEETILRPFLELNLNNPIYKAGVKYRRTQIENKITGIPDTEDFRDEVDTVLGWKPAGLPEWNLRYFYTHTYDDPETVDSIENLLTLDGRHNIGNELDLGYFYTRTARENSISGTETLEQTHNGRIDYSRNLLNKRLFLNTGYRIRYNTFEFETIGNVEFPVLLDHGLSSNDDSLLAVTLDINDELIDGDRDASAGINIGSLGSAAQLPNIGLQFVLLGDVDKIHVWVQEPLSQAVAASFSWTIYTSDNNITWTPGETVSGSFGPFENRFVISFQAVNTEYIKVVTTPLAAGEVPENIFVTEMWAFTTVSGVTLDKQTTITEHNYNLNLRGKLGDQTVLGYNMFYNLLERDPSSEKKTELSNSVYLRHRFNRIFSGTTSFAQTDRTLNDEQSVNNTYSASLRAAYLETLEQILTYSGTQTSEDEGSGSTDSLFLRTNAELYRGWSAFLDLGYSSDSPAGRADATSTIIRSGTNIVPNAKTTININYSITDTQESGGENRQTSKSILDTQIFLTPFRALSLNAKLRFEDREDSTTTSQNYSANWSPFPDGDLQFFFTYTETLRPEDDQESRTIGPSMKWTIGRHAFLDMAYTVTENETRLQTIESNSLNAKLRIVF
jgi:hypothetical protein